MLCVCVRISSRHALSQTCRGERVHRGSIVFDSPRRTHLPRTPRHSRLRIRSRWLLLIGISWYQKFVGPLFAESIGGDWRIIGAVVPATFDGHTSNVCSILFFDTCWVLGS